MGTQLLFEETNQELFAFLDKSPTAFHAAANIAEMLEKNGYSQLLEGEKWAIEPGKGYYVMRNGSSLIAFYAPEKAFRGFRIMASHSDSPAFKIKANAEIQVENTYLKLNVEKYGGMLMASWMDRPLSVAGRIVMHADHGMETKLVNIERDLVVIPSLAIHMNRAVNEGNELNAQRDLLPLFAQCGWEETEAGERALLQLIADESGVQASDILDTDLFLYPRMKATYLGLHDEFIAAPHLDDLQCVFASVKGFLAALPKLYTAVLCVLDNEEVGSSTKQGAASTFLKDVLRRVNSSLGRTEEEYLTALADSFLVSADNAHGVHPNYTDKADPSNRPYMNKGIVIKYSANQRYTTDAVSGAMFKLICEKAGVPWQTFHNRSDIAGGSTLGNISGNQVAVNSVDVGLAQLAMHSCFEMAGSRDTAYLAEAARVLFEE